MTRFRLLPAGRQAFYGTDWDENIQIGLSTRGKGKDTCEREIKIFPRLRDRPAQRVDTLSGEEQQMLATVYALCRKLAALWLNEPAEGLQPSVIQLIHKTMIVIHDQSQASMLVEQSIEASLSIADRVLVIENGQGREVVDTQDLRDDPDLLQKYAGF